MRTRLLGCFAAILAVGCVAPVDIFLPETRLAFPRPFPSVEAPDGACVVTGSVNLSTESCSGRSTPDAPAFRVASIAQGTRSSNLQLLPTADGLLAVGDRVLVLDLYGTPADNATVGTWEIGHVLEVVGPAVRLDALSNAADFELAGHRVLVQRFPRYESVLVAAGATLTSNPFDCTADDASGVLAFSAESEIRIAGTLIVSSGGLPGGTGGPDQQNHNSGHSPSRACLAPWMIQGIAQNGSGGGGGAANDVGADPANGGGGGGGGYAASGTNGSAAPSNSNIGGSGGDARGTIDLRLLLLGSGGGEGGNELNGPPGDGGDGGGIILLAASTIVVEASGGVLGDGEIGQRGQNTAGGGGGGAGGSILLQARTIDLVVGTGKGVRTQSGVAGQALNGGDGGAGSDGRIAVQYETSISGSTVPPAAVLQQPFVPYFVPYD